MTQEQSLPTKKQLRLADFSPEELLEFLEQLPPTMLKEVAATNEKSLAQLMAEKEAAYTELENQIIPKHAIAYLEWVKAGKELKAEIFSDLKVLMDLKFDLVEFKDKKVFGNLKSQKSLTFNVEPFILRVGRRAKDTFSHDAKVGLAKIEEYINSQQLDPNVSSLLISLIEKDNNGNLTPSSIMSLQKAIKSDANQDGINDESFTEGVRLLTRSWKKLMSCFYIEVGKQDNLGKIAYEPGSFSAYDVPVDFTYFQDSLAEAEIVL